MADNLTEERKAQLAALNEAEDALVNRWAKNYPCGQIRRLPLAGTGGSGHRRTSGSTSVSLRSGVTRFDDSPRYLE